MRNCMVTRKVFFPLLLIVLLGAILRFYQLGQIPALHRDEAFLGYNAYSILKTGKDMSGVFLPLHFESFIYSPSGYSYLTIPSIIIFGLTSFSIRFPAAFFGTLTIVLTFFLTIEVFSKHKYKNYLGYLSSFLIAISPWHINLSKTATENVVVVFFLSFGAILILKWLKNKKSVFLFSSFLMFFLTLLIYQAPRAFLPFFIPLLLITFFTEIKKNKKLVQFISLFLITILLPLFVILSSKELSLRIRTVSIFADKGTQLILDEQIRRDGTKVIPTIVTRTFHNKFFSYSSIVVENYFKHFSFDFLFTDQGYPQRYSVPLVGLLYIFELPFLIFGAYSLLRFSKKTTLFLVGWWLIAPIGSALTSDDIPNLQRTLIAFPVIPIISALGLCQFFLFLKNKFLISSFTLVLSSVVVYSLLFYFHQYYFHFSAYMSWYRQDGYETLVSNVNKNLVNYKKAVITNRESAPTIFFLFYGRYDPLKFQQDTKESKLRDFDRLGFGKYEFSQEECPLKLSSDSNILYVDSGFCNVPPQAKIVATVKRKDDSTVFYILENRIEAKESLTK